MQPSPQSASWLPGPDRWPVQPNPALFVSRHLQARWPATPGRYRRDRGVWDLRRKGPYEFEISFGRARSAAIPPAPGRRAPLLWEGGEKDAMLLLRREPTGRRDWQPLSLLDQPRSRPWFRVPPPTGLL